MIDDGSPEEQHQQHMKHDDASVDLRGNFIYLQPTRVHRREAFRRKMSYKSMLSLLHRRVIAAGVIIVLLAVLVLLPSATIVEATRPVIQSTDYSVIWKERVSKSVIFWGSSQTSRHVLFLRGGSSGVPPPMITRTAESQFRKSETDERIPPVSYNALVINTTDIFSSQEKNVSAVDQPMVEGWRSRFPSVLQRKSNATFQKLTLGNVDIYLLGTAHVSNDSSRDVQVLLDCVHPDAIFVELCDSRIPLLEGAPNTTAHNLTVHDTSDTISPNKEVTAQKNREEGLWRRVTTLQETQGGSRMQALSTILLTNVQEEYAEELNVELGGEFQCAHRYWKKTHIQKIGQWEGNTERMAEGPPYLILGDRPMQLTLIRAWESLTWWPKVKVLVALIWSCLRKPNKEEMRKWLDSVMKEESDVLTKSFEELRKHFPTLYRTIVAERDAWLAAKLVQSCRGLSAASADPDQNLIVVAIVDAGHVNGIVQWLTSNNTGKTPSQILQELVATKRWANDPLVQERAIPTWVTELSVMQQFNNNDS